MNFISNFGTAYVGTTNVGTTNGLACTYFCVKAFLFIVAFISFTHFIRTKVRFFIGFIMTQSVIFKLKILTIFRVYVSIRKD